MKSSVVRVGLGVLAALILTPIVVGGMAKVIFVEEIELEEKITFELSSIVPDVEASDTRTRRRAQATRRNNSAKPPPIKKLKISKSDIKIDAVNMDVAPPSNLNIGRMSSFAAKPIAINDRDARPIRPPPRKYPTRALERGIEGSCDVSFDVDTRGRPYNVSADCTNSVFKREAERSVGKAEFSPKIQNGKPIERRGVVYPMEFVLGD